MENQISEQTEIKKRGNPNWHKGQSANPGGRVKNRISLTAMLEAELHKHPIINDKPSEHTWAELLLQAWLHNALKQPVLMKELIERIDGKSLESIDVTTKGEAITKFIVADQATKEAAERIEAEPCVN